MLQQRRAVNWEINQNQPAYDRIGWTVGRLVSFDRDSDPRDEVGRANFEFVATTGEDREYNPYARGSHLMYYAKLIPELKGCDRKFVGSSLGNKNRKLQNYQETFFCFQWHPHPSDQTPYYPNISTIRALPYSSSCNTDVAVLLGKYDDYYLFRIISNNYDGSDFINKCEPSPFGGIYEIAIPFNDILPSEAISGMLVTLKMNSSKSISCIPELTFETKLDKITPVNKEPVVLY